jgi:hypothetical protein
MLHVVWCKDCSHAVGAAGLAACYPLTWCS